LIHTLRVNGIQLNVSIEGSGPCIMLLHGFPDSLKLWRKVTPYLVQAGFRVVSYDQRGYGESDAPLAVRQYTTELIVQDALAVIDKLELGENINLVGHDWGSLIGWKLCLEHPQRFRKYVAVSVGHPLAYRHAGIEQKRKGWYVLAFQVPALPEYLLSKNNWSEFRRMAKGHPEVDTWIADLARPGRITAAINWYRANFAQLIFSDFDHCTVPTLGIYSAGDLALTEQQMVDSARYMDADWSYRRIEKSSHWIPLDQPQILAEECLSWFSAQ
jgi:pimeloyl-ACP methyl ester carboxylesterase